MLGLSLRRMGRSAEQGGGSGRRSGGAGLCPVPETLKPKHCVHVAQYVGEESALPGAVAAQADAAADEADTVGEGASAPPGVRAVIVLT